MTDKPRYGIGTTPDTEGIKGGAPVMIDDDYKDALERKRG